jgi:iron complex transport system substrate-binding protein
MGGLLVLLGLTGTIMGARSERPCPIAPPGANLPREAHRAVLFEGYEIVAALKAWDRVVGISHYAYDNDLLKQVVPHLKQIPSPGSGFVVNAESLLALKPDMVVTWDRKPDQVDFIRRQGIPVTLIYPEGLADLYRDTLRLGRLLGQPERAEKVTQLMARNLEALRQRLAKIPAAARPRVAWVWGKPTTITGNKGVVGELIPLAGGINLGSKVDNFNQELSMETLVELNPEVVLIWGSASYGVSDLLRDPKWQTIRAVKTGRVFKASRASTWSPRVVVLAWWMAHCFFPQEISPAEYRQAVDAFYRECFGIPYEGTP